jgi:2-keto-4-pentenoate hydratase
MNDESIRAAAALLLENWRRGTRIAGLPPASRPAGRADGYAISAEIERQSGDRRVGWKIAATSVAGQRHIGVDGPLAGPLFASRVLERGANVCLDGNVLRVAEAEFAFRMIGSLPARRDPYGVDEVMAAVGGLHLAVEIPDSRYDDAAAVGAPQLIADCACASWLVVGPDVAEDWRGIDLARHTVRAMVNGETVAEGTGANVLGDPRIALAWIANELRALGVGLRAGEIVTTGTCVVPVPVRPGDRLAADFGALGVIEVGFE